MRGGELNSNKVYSGSIVSGVYAVGGIVGSMDMCAVKDNESHAEISGSLYISGGIIGKISSIIPGSISGNKYSGAKWGIGEDYEGSPSNEGCISISEEDYSEKKEDDVIPDRDTDDDMPAVENNTSSPDSDTNNDSKEEPEAKTDNTETDGNSGSSGASGGGGCNIGIGFIMAYVLTARRFFVRK